MEGPSIHSLEKRLEIFINKRIEQAYGNAKFDKDELVGQKIKDIFAFGKKLIIQLEEHAIITHFLMYGTYRIDEERPGLMPRLALLTNKHSLYFYSCSVKCEKIKNIKKIFLLTHDILSPEWAREEIVSIMRKKPQETLDDVLLDQEIFPGVGNIIKNEALALSYLKPQKKIVRLSLKKIIELAQNARNFSQTFLEKQDSWPDFKTTMLVYGRKTCARCGSTIIRKITGKRKRRSFFCPQCQK